MSYHENIRINLMIETLLNKKGLDVQLIDLKNLSDCADFFIICTGTSDQHVKSLSEDLSDKLKQFGDPPWHIEGADTRNWMLIDFVDIVVHVFRQETREFYGLERLWGDAKIKEFTTHFEPEIVPRSPFEFS
jgi:ribosome-associated protein